MYIPSTRSSANRVIGSDEVESEDKGGGRVELDSWDAGVQDRNRKVAAASLFTSVTARHLAQPPSLPTHNQSILYRLHILPYTVFFCYFCFVIVISTSILEKKPCFRSK